MYKLILAPEQSTYAVTDGTEVVSTKLDGGASRNRLDILNSTSQVTCTWRLGPEEYTYIRAFYRSAVASGSLPFLIDLILDLPELREFTARFTPGTMRLVEQRGLTYVVSAELEVEPIPADTNFDIGMVSVIGAYGFNPQSTLDIFELLEELVNQDLDID